MKKSIILMVLACAMHQSTSAAAKSEKMTLEWYIENLEDLNEYLTKSPLGLMQYTQNTSSDIKKIIEHLTAANEYLTKAILNPQSKTRLDPAGRIQLSSLLGNIMSGNNTSLEKLLSPSDQPSDG